VPPCYSVRQGLDVLELGDPPHLDRHLLDAGEAATLNNRTSPTTPPYSNSSAPNAHKPTTSPDPDR